MLRSTQLGNDATSPSANADAYRASAAASSGSSTELAGSPTSSMLSQVTETVRIQPGPGQESVWDYPRSPRVEPCRHRLVVEFGGTVVADTVRGLRVLETSQAPAYYLPRAHVADDHLVPTPTCTFCEWKGEASYLTVAAGGGAPWSMARGPDCPPEPAVRRADRPHRLLSPADGCMLGRRRTGRRVARARSMAAGSRRWWSGRSRVLPAPRTGEPVKIRVLSVFEGVVYHCWPTDLSHPDRPVLEVEAVLREGDADAASGPLLLSVADYITMVGGLEPARPGPARAAGAKDASSSTWASSTSASRCGRGSAILIERLVEVARAQALEVEGHVAVAGARARRRRPRPGCATTSSRRSSGTSMRASVAVVADPQLAEAQRSQRRLGPLDLARAPTGSPGCRRAPATPGRRPPACPRCAGRAAARSPARRPW